MILLSVKKSAVSINDTPYPALRGESITWQIGNKFSKSVSKQLSNFQEAKKMNVKFNLKYIWLGFGVLSMILITLFWFGYDSQNMQNTMHVLNVLMLILSVPCSLFAVPVIFLANHFLGIAPFSAEGINLATIFLFVLGMMQWFWIARLWSPDKYSFQKIDLLDAKIN